MPLSLDVLILGVPRVPESHAFYAAALAPEATDYGGFVRLDLHGTGQLGLYGGAEVAAEAKVDPAGSGFRGFILSYVVDQPTEVETVLAAAARAGATVLKPAKKSLFGAFSAVFEAPDGAIWKLSAPTKTDTGPAADPPRPTETGVLLGVDDPKASKAFYTALGMTVDRDYGAKYIDFKPLPGGFRFGLMTRKVLAKDAGVDPAGEGFGGAVLSRDATSRDQVDAALGAAAAAGGQITAPASETEWGGYVGHFADPDGFVWKVASP